MDRWKFEELLSEETKNRLFEALNKDLKEDDVLEADIKTDEGVADFFNVTLDNSYFELIKYVVTDK